jgi:predicted nucleotidyltransferase
MSLSLQEVTSYIINDLNGFLVGSHAWGGATPGSDYDFVIEKTIW